MVLVMVVVECLVCAPGLKQHRGHTFALPVDRSHLWMRICTLSSPCVCSAIQQIKDVVEYAKKGNISTTHAQK